jgi:hypothetical protein
MRGGLSGVNSFLLNNELNFSRIHVVEKRPPIGD